MNFFCPHILLCSGSNEIFFYRLLKANCLYCNLLEFDGLILLDNTKGWTVASPQEERILMEEALRKKLDKMKGRLKQNISNKKRR